MQRTINPVVAKFTVHDLAHITDRGITDNLPRVIPASTHAVIDLSAWQLPPVFQWLRAASPMTGAEILRTFNCGVGMLLVVAGEDVDPLTEFLRTQRETLFRVGRIAAGEQLARVVYAQVLR